MNKYDIYTWVLKIINSCICKEQIDNAFNLVIAYHNRNFDHSLYCLLSTAYWEKQRELTNNFLY